MMAAKEIEDRYDTEFEHIGCGKDHVHILCTAAHPEIAPGQIVRVFKSITARELFKRKPDLKRDLWGGEFWTDGYYVATVGERTDWGMVGRYVKNPGKPKEELRQFELFSNTPWSCHGVVYYEFFRAEGRASECRPESGRIIKSHENMPGN